MKNNFEEVVCPACSIIDRFGDKWSLRILLLLREQGVMRFNEIQKSISGLSQKVLTSSLRTLEADTLIVRKVYPEVPPRVEYQLTSLGESLMGPLDELINWAKLHSEEILANRRSKFSGKVN